MNIHMTLSEDSIDSAISQLKDALDDLKHDAGEWVDIMTTEGAVRANMAYGSMASASGQRDESEQDGIVNGHIGVSGASDATVVIAEFGAGDTTESNTFENEIPGIQVYAGEYSQNVGSGEYWDRMQENGGPDGGENVFWRWGGAKLHQVIARHGLRDAKDFILQNGGDIAREVLLHD